MFDSSNWQRGDQETERVGTEPEPRTIEEIGMTEIRGRPVAKFVAAFLVGFVFFLVPVPWDGQVTLRRIIEDHDGLEFLFSAFIGAIITGTSIVVTINQLVLSQELGAVGDQRERMQESMEFARTSKTRSRRARARPSPRLSSTNS